MYDKIQMIPFYCSAIKPTLSAAKNAGKEKEEQTLKADKSPMAKCDKLIGFRVFLSIYL